MSETIIRFDAVTKTYIMGTVRIEALRGVDLHVDRGEFLALSGPSGSGKTTLLNIMGCIERPTTGTIHVLGSAVMTSSDNDLAHLRAHTIGFVFQNFNLLPVLTAYENVEFPLLNHKISKSERHSRVEEALAAVDLSDRHHHKPLEMSGGQRQRVAIARAMVTRPAFILADEPTANLDHATAEHVLDLMQLLNTQKNTTFIFSTHDPRIVRRASRIIEVSDGMITQPA